MMNYLSDASLFHSFFLHLFTCVLLAFSPANKLTSSSPFPVPPLPFASPFIGLLMLVSAIQTFLYRIAII